MLNNNDNPGNKKAMFLAQFDWNWMKENKIMAQPAVKQTAQL